MTFHVTRASNWNYHATKAFFTLDELIAFMQKERSPIIIRNNGDYKEPIEPIMKWNKVSEDEAREIANCEFSIQIYDDYIE